MCWVVDFDALSWQPVEVELITAADAEVTVSKEGSLMLSLCHIAVDCAKLWREFS